jgi:hypothetical protein
MGIRDSINAKPWLGWLMAGIILVGAVVMYFQLSGGSGSAFSSDRATEMMTIKFTDTGKTIEMPRGRVIRQLMDRGKDIDSEKGIENPETHQFTGFPYDKNGWDSMVAEIKKANSAEGHVKTPSDK